MAQSAANTSRGAHDAIVVGSGPNGLAGAITLAQAGLSVIVYEAKETIGGGLRTRELTMPGLRHDVCAAIHPLALVSPFFRTLNLAAHGLQWIESPIALTHPLDDGTAVALHRSLEKTAAGMGPDAKAYTRLMAPLVRNYEGIIKDTLKPLGFPSHPFVMARFGLKAIRSAMSLADATFSDVRAKAIFAGNSAHSILPLEQRSSAAFGLMLGMLGHSVGWPMAQGGSEAISTALASVFKSLGGTIEVNSPVLSLTDLPKAKIILCDVSPLQLAAMGTGVFDQEFRKRLESHKYGPGVFKVDWALETPVPWTAEVCHRSATVHVGGTMEEIAQSEAEVWRGVAPEKPFVLFAQQSIFDPSRSSGTLHTGWGYCHVPNGCVEDMTDRIEAQIERFAPGFRDRVTAISVMKPAQMELYNPNYVGGDIAGGIQSFQELFLKPLDQWGPYTTPVDGLYICSSSMPPGAGVHGMCGHLAAKSALKEVLGRTVR